MTTKNRLTGFVLGALFVLFSVYDVPAGPEGPESMVPVRGGCFLMGDVFDDPLSRSRPVHRVCVDDFFMARHEVTLAEFRRFVEETGYRTEAEVQDGCHSWEGRGEMKRREFTWKFPGFRQEDNHPVVCVSWNDSRKYIEWINSVSGRQYRLPTEAEWEFAARSRGRDLQYAWGKGEPSDNIADNTAFRKLLGASPASGYDDGYAFTAPAGSFNPSELGLYDMSGNVYEWVGDWYGKDYYDRSPRYNPRGPFEGAFKIMRGGSWNPLPELVTTTTRRWNVSGARGAWIGFRLVHPGEVSP